MAAKKSKTAEVAEQYSAVTVVGCYRGDTVCCVCGRAFSHGALLVGLAHQRGDEESVCLGWLCPDCLALGNEVSAARARERAKMLERIADGLAIVTTWPEIMKRAEFPVNEDDLPF